MADFIEIATGESIRVDFADFAVEVCRRDVDADGGLTIGLAHTSEGEDQDLIRFDVFRDDPHYHAPATDPKPIKLDTQSFEESLEFVLRCLERRLPELLCRADFPDLAAQIDPSEMAGIAARVRTAAASAPEPSSTQRIELTPAMRALLDESAS